MGLYDWITIEADVPLPKFPADHRPDAIDWQTKGIGQPCLRRFKLTASGRLLRQEQEMRKKTAAEKQAEAEEHGFETWTEYVSFRESADPEELLDRGLGIKPANEQTVAKELWLDHTIHGTFEFHGTDDAVANGFFWSYEARFTCGDLDAIVFLGSRSGDVPTDFRPDAQSVVRF